MSEELEERVNSARALFRSVYCDDPNNLQKAIMTLKNSSDERGDGKLFSMMILTKELNWSLADAIQVIETSEAWK